MTVWVARYQEGYTTEDGETVILVDKEYREHPWPSPEVAVRYWLSRTDLTGAGTHRVGNGLQQTDDVRERSEFATLHVTTIWRRVTFEHPSVPTGASRVSEVDGTDEASGQPSEAATD